MEETAKLIKIVWSSDYSDCETCGMSSDYGAEVWIDDEKVVDSPAAASCYGGSRLSESDAYKKILEYLGFTVEEEYVENPYNDPDYE